MVSLDVTTREISDIAIIKLKGFLNADTCPLFEETLHGFMEQKKYKIIVDFEFLEYISSAGVGCFIGNIKLIRKNGGDIRFLSLPPTIKRVFQLLDFQDFFQSYDEQHSAFESFK